MTLFVEIQVLENGGMCACGSEKVRQRAPAGRLLYLPTIVTGR